MAKSLTWTDNGLASEDGRFVIGVVHNLKGEPVEFYWERHPLLKTKVVGEHVVKNEGAPEDGADDDLSRRIREVTEHTVVDVEVVSDERPHGAETLEEMHDQAAAMNRSRSALDKFKAPRAAARDAAKAARRQDAEDAQLDALVAKLMARPGFAERLGGDR